MSSETEVPFGPTGRVVFERTYSRTKPNGDKETWPQTVRRVAEGNLALVYGERAKWASAVEEEYDDLVRDMERMAILPAGRHLWASGVKGRQYLFNCHVAGWGKKLSDHFEFTFMRLMEGGGVGANYSSRFLTQYGAPRRSLNVHIVCNPSHPDYGDMKGAPALGAPCLLSDDFHYEWEGAFPVEDSREGWAAALVDLIDTHMTDDEVRHQDRVYDVSRVRCKGSPLRTFGGTASGPKPFAAMMRRISEVLNPIDFGHIMPTEAMDMDHAIAECVVSGGVRRSARMAICHWADPYIEEFLASKEDASKNWTTNISVEIDEDFTEALGDESHDNWGHATSVHQSVVKGMLTNGEPGYWNSTLSNVGEPGLVIATNPCGEIALQEWENCNLGHVNLDAFAPTVKDGPADMLGLIRAHRLVTRFLIRATYGDVTDPKQGDVLARNRRIGVGHLGVQGFWAKQGIAYSNVPHEMYAERLLTELHDAVRKEARDYAFQLRIPEPVKVTTVAPTGTIAKLPGVTEGIHPIYARHFIRRVRFSNVDEAQAKTVSDAFLAGLVTEQCQYDQSGNTWIVQYPTKEKLVAEVEALGYDAEVVESADEISVADMLAFQAMYQRHWSDNATSFTVNVPAEPHQAEYMLANPTGRDIPAPSPERAAAVAETIAGFLSVLKGTTLMLDGARAQAPYERITEAEYEAAAVKSIEDGTDEDCATGACPIR